ncbi:hypothetical protein DEO72_LG2g3097 [Vigna unguiculata]|uniref:Uncharacterized protein n=1 Tax=Vigna unguiculata TaxID=3917 RepID=A0A4D6L2Q9_VIGUN|nr:hypothetical protein DEO72_LG2g3097 [Vigna unguiculata]
MDKEPLDNKRGYHRGYNGDGATTERGNRDSATEMKRRRQPRRRWRDDVMEMARRRDCDDPTKMGWRDGDERARRRWDGATEMGRRDGDGRRDEDGRRDGDCCTRWLN